MDNESVHKSGQKSVHTKWTKKVYTPKWGQVIKS